MLTTDFDQTRLLRLFEYDVALSFAGEDRVYADELAHRLTNAGIRVFYDSFEQADFWGRNLVEHLGDVYSQHARFCVMFASKAYAQKAWPTHERRAAQERAFREAASEYILPIRIDETKIPGLPSTVAYIDIHVGVEEISELLLQKLKNARLRSVSILSASAKGDEQSGRGYIIDTIKLDDTGPAYAYAFSSSGKRVLTGGQDKIMRLWDLATGRCVRTFEGHAKAVECIAWGGDEHLALSAADDHSARIWDVSTGQCLRVLEGHTSDIWSVAWSPDRRNICSGSNDHTVRLWDVESGSCAAILEGHTDYVTSVEWTRAGVISASEDGSVRLWDSLTGRCLRKFQEQNSPVYCAVSSPDQSRILSSAADGSMRLWDVETSRCLCVLEGHTTFAVTLAFAANGRYAISGSGDCDVRLWDLGTRSCAAVFKGHVADVRCVKWDIDQRHAISGDESGQIITWGVGNPIGQD